MFRYEILDGNEASTPVPPYMPRTPREPVPEEHEEHKPKSDNDSIIICQVCGRSFVGRTELELHFETERKSRRKKRNELMPMRAN